MEIVIGITGASGVQYGIHLLDFLAGTDIKTHLILTETAKKIIGIETDLTVEQIIAKADVVHDEMELSASIASGSHRFKGMIIAPCSMKSLSSIANGYSDNLLVRTADVCLKEKRELILMTRETPLSRIHLENMLRAQKAGAMILPACPGFYNRPERIDDLIRFMTGRSLDLLGIENNLYERWE